MTTNGVKNWDTLESVPFAPGYRDVSMRLQLHTGQNIEVNLKPIDARELYDQLQSALQLAWDSGHEPLDFKPGEARPHNLPVREKRSSLTIV